MTPESLAGVGARVRRAREERGMTVAELARLTRIRPGTLEGIEAGRPADLPGEVYVRGFLRVIAREVGLDPAEILLALSGTDSQPPPGPGSPELVSARSLWDDEQKRTRRWAIALAVVIVILLAALAFSIFFGGRREGALTQGRGPAAVAATHVDFA